MAELVVAVSDAIDLGRGFDTLAGRSAGWGLLPAKVGAPAAGGGSSYTFTYTLVQDIDDLAKALDINAKLSMRFGLFGADAKFSFAESCKVHDESLFITLSIRVQRAAQQLQAPLTYDPTALEIRSKSTPADFRAAYGDAYVVAVRTGGELAVVLEIHTHSSDQRQEIAASLKGSYGIKFDAETSFKKSFAEQTTGRQISAYVYQVGGTPISLTDDAGQIDGTKVLTAAQGFLEELTGPDNTKAVPFEATLLPWTTAPVVGAPSTVDVEQAAQLLDALAVQQRRCLDRLALLRFIAENPDAYDWTTGPALAEVEGQATEVAATLAKVLQIARAIGHDITYEATAEDLASAYAAIPAKPAVTAKTVALTVPNVIGRSEDDARGTLIAAGFAPAPDGEVYDDDKPAGQVASTVPGPGEPAAQGAVVSFALTTDDPAKKPIFLKATNQMWIHGALPALVKAAGG